MSEYESELTELAAKAHGKCKYFNDAWRCAETGYREFNPLNDDGDALRTAIELDMQITVNRVDAYVEVISGYHGENRIREMLHPDKYAATRIAIVRAAAEIGKTL